MILFIIYCIQGATLVARLPQLFFAAVIVIDVSRIRCICRIERDVRGFTSDTISFTTFCGFVSLEGETYFTS